LRFQFWVRTAEHSCDYTTRVKAKLLDDGIDRYFGISGPTSRAVADGDTALNLARREFARMSCRTDKRDPYGVAQQPPAFGSERFVALSRDANQGSAESVPPSQIPQALRIAGCDRDSYEWRRFHFRDRTATSLSRLSTCGPTWE